MDIHLDIHRIWHWIWKFWNPVNIPFRSNGFRTHKALEIQVSVVNIHWYSRWVLHWRKSMICTPYPPMDINSISNTSPVDLMKNIHWIAIGFHMVDINCRNHHKSTVFPVLYGFEIHWIWMGYSLVFRIFISSAKSGGPGSWCQGGYPLDIQNTNCTRS